MVPHDRHDHILDPRDLLVLHLPRAASCRESKKVGKAHFFKTLARRRSDSKEGRRQAALYAIAAVLRSS